MNRRRTSAWAPATTSVSWWRRRWTLETPTADLPERRAPDAAEGALDRRDLWDAVRRLPRRQRAVVVLRYLEDRTETETAQLLGCAVGTVKSQSSKALAKLRLDAALEPVTDEEVGREHRGPEGSRGAGRDRHGTRGRPPCRGARPDPDGATAPRRRSRRGLGRGGARTGGRRPVAHRDEGTRRRTGRQPHPDSVEPDRERRGPRRSGHRGPRHPARRCAWVDDARRTDQHATRPSGGGRPVDDGGEVLRGRW